MGWIKKIVFTLNEYYMKNYILSLFTTLVVISSCEDKQGVNAPFLEIKSEEKIINMAIEGGSCDIKVHSNLDIIQIVPQDVGGYSWCTYSLGMTASNVHVLNINVAKNDGIGVRQSDFILKGNGVENDTIHIRQLGTEPAILANVTSKYLTKDSQEFNIEITSNVDYKQVTSSDWLQLKSANETRSEIVTNSFTYIATANDGFAMRRDTIVIFPESETSTLKVKIPVEQKGADIDDVMPMDTKIKIERVKRIRGNCYQEATGNYLETKTIDGDYLTGYASANSKENENIMMEYSLAEPKRVDYILIHPFPGVNDLNKLTTGTIRYKKNQQDSEWTECGTFESQDKTAIVRVDVNLDEVGYLQLELKRSGTNQNNNVNFAEFECYQKAEGGDFDLTKDAEFFADNVFSKLKETTKLEDIQKITHPMVRSIAKELLNGTYSTEFRSRVYKSCKDPNIVGSELTIGRRSIYDNPTGIYFEKNKKYFVFVGDELGTDKLNLHIRDWREGGGNQTLALVSGINLIQPKNDGNGYIQYWTETELDIPKAVNVHICYGIELGFWDIRQYDNEDWKRIIKNAAEIVTKENIQTAMFDVCGELVQLVNTLDAFNTYCPNDIVSVMVKHDELMKIEYETMGLYKYNVVPKNRIHGVRSWGGNPNWNGTHANIPNRERTMLTVDGFLEDLWVYAHEFGHGNQVRQMKGGGWGEVTNNLYAVKVQFLMNNTSLRLEHEAIDRKGYGNEKVVGDRFNGYLNDAIVSHIDYLKHQGEWAYQNGEKYHGADPFTTLCPLWQLSLLFEFTKGNPDIYRPDFYADVHWDAIQNEEGTDYENFGQRYVNFMKRSMKAANMNLTKFFENIGLLRELDFPAAAYGDPDHILITGTMVDEVKNYAKQFPNPQPETLEMNYISGNTVEIYRQRLPMSGTYGEGVTDGESVPNTKIIAHSVWKNVVAYETIDDNGKLIEVCISGTGSASNTSTLVRYPEGATGIRAVSWDGTRKMVYGK